MAGSDRNGPSWSEVEASSRPIESARARRRRRRPRGVRARGRPPAASRDPLRAGPRRPGISLGTRPARRLEDYQRRFPDLFRDRRRVRRSGLRGVPAPAPGGRATRRRPSTAAGSASTAATGRCPARLGRRTRRRGRPPHGAIRASGRLATPRPPPTGSRSAASAYRAFRRGPGDDGPRSSIAASALGPCASTPTSSATLHRTDPTAAERLARAVAAMPEAGVGLPRLPPARELGRGAFGRVFLARQGDLADRPVALKVSADVVGRVAGAGAAPAHQLVPIYSVHRARAAPGGLHALPRRRPPWPTCSPT